MGPMARADLRDSLHEQVEQSIAGGARLLEGGTIPDQAGAWYPPTLLTDVTPGMPAYDDELFGPVAAVLPVTDEAEAIRVANDTPMGLAAYFFARDVGRVWRVSEALEYGMIGANTGMMSTAVAPFGGIKESGLGREGSRHGIDDWTELKYVRMAGI